MANISFELIFAEIQVGDDHILRPRDFIVHRIIKGREELSSLYSYELLIEPVYADYICPPERVRRLLNTYIHLRVKHDDTIIQSICGSILSIEAFEFNDTSNAAVASMQKTGTKTYYKWIIRPHLAKACYSLNRRVWRSSESTDAPLAEQVLRSLAWNWYTKIEFTRKAKAALPKNLLQLRQNDESDYNFFARLLFTWGLGYFWDISGEKEIVYIFDASCEEDFQTEENIDIRGGEFAHASMDRPDHDAASFWKVTYGALDSTDIHLQNYYHSEKPLGNVMLHDETWDQFSSFSESDAEKHEARLISRYRSVHDNSFACLGMFRLSSDGSSAADLNAADHASTIRPGKKITWKKGVSLSDPDDQFIITGLTINAANREWKAEIRGRCPHEGIGILPHPVRLNYHSRSGDEELIADELWSEPRMRFFMAVVHDEESLTDDAMQGRNLCCVRELMPDDGLPPHSFWVEMASPHADANSGIFARPRKGNVLICLDRGDLSIPIALGAMFRHGNAAPFAQLKQLDREKRKDKEDILLDLSALTLRSRTHTPAIHKNPSGSNADDQEASDSIVENAESISRPLSVHQLAKKPLGFNQIQLVSQSNGINPITQPEKIDDKYLCAAASNTALSATTGMSASAAYADVAAVNAMQTEWNRPITRPHFEGISMYSTSDFLLQSADHQLINAGGEIVLTSAQAITLRVGTSCIKITQAGIEISCKTGKVRNPGAYPAYHTGPEWDEDNEKILNHGDAQEINVMGGALPIGGKIWVDFSGVNTQGPYIANAALTMFSASTLLGSNLSLSDFSAGIFAPKTTIIGGATMVDTISNVAQSIMNGVDDRMSYQIGDNGGSPYTGELTEGYKTLKADFSVNAWNRSFQVINAAGAIWGFISSKGAKITNLLRMKGSMVKLEPSTLTATGDETLIRGMKVSVGSCAIAPLAALGERSGVSAAPSDGNMFEQIAYAGDQIAAFVNDATPALLGIKRLTELDDKKGKERRKDIAVGVLGIISSVTTMLAKVFAFFANKAALKNSSLAKEDYTITDSKEQDISKNTTVGKWSDAIAERVQKLLAKKQESVKNDTATVVSGDQSVKQETQTVQETTEAVQSGTTAASESQTAASESSASATSTTSGALNTNTSAVKIN